MARLIRISESDYNLLKNEVKKEYLKHHPEMEMIPLTFIKMVHECVKFYLNN